MSTHNNHSDAVLRVLADGQFHSGERLAERIGVSRSAVWKQVRTLAGLGLEVFRVPGKGYRLAAPLELLDASRIRAGLAPAHRARLKDLHVLNVVDSTNTWLAAHAQAVPAVCLAEMQTAGRGRRGRHWVSPFGANLYLSCLWQFEELPPGFTALGMAAAIAAARALHVCGAQGVAVKWPNDLVAGGIKLGGILVDVQGESSGGMRAVIGVGINVHMPAQAASGIDQPWTDLVSQLHGVVPDRNALAATLLDELFRALERFGAQGFAAFGEDWRALDQVAGRAVILQQHDRRISGTARGVDQDGALLLETGGETRRFVSGDISLRVQA